MSTALTLADIGDRFLALERAQEAWEEYAYVANPKIPCPECAGAGQVYGGSLGNVCVRCMGGRVLDAPGSDPVVMPPFASLRGQLANYADALDRHLELPDASYLPTVEDLEALRVVARGYARNLLASGQAPGVVPKHLLSEAKEARGMVGEGGIGDYEDAELAQVEDEDEDKNR